MCHDELRPSGSSGIGCFSVQNRYVVRSRISEARFRRFLRCVAADLTAVQIWGCAKIRLASFRGMHPSTFCLHLKECEFRFNCRREHLYKVLLTLCRVNPLR